MSEKEDKNMSSNVLTQTTRKFQVCITKLQNFFVSLALKNLIEMSSLTLQAHLDPVGQILDNSPAVIPWDRFYCCFQFKNTLRFVGINRVLLLYSYN